SDGTPVAINRTVYSILMNTFRLDSETIEESIDRIAELTGREELRSKAEQVLSTGPKWKSVALVDNLSFGDISPILERLYQLPGIIVEKRHRRHYPLRSLVGHVTGYTGAISAGQLERYLEDGYLPEDRIGKLGSELQFEPLLRGTHGREVYVQDASGRRRSRRAVQPAIRGNDIVLTIDLALQTFADDLLTGHRGAAIVMDPRNGAILALVSKQDYDPNYPMRGMHDGLASQYNKVIQFGGYSPASTFKLVTGSAALLMGLDLQQKENCTGTYEVRLPDGGTQVYYCDPRYGHGRLDFYGAIQRSCNVFFYRLADRAGGRRMIETARAFGFGEPTGIDLKPEGRGVLARPGVDRIYQGSVIQMGIGQGALIAVTPIQLINAYATLANGGRRYRPHLLKEIRLANQLLDPKLKAELMEQYSLSEVDRGTSETILLYQPEVLSELPLDEFQRRALLEGFRRVVQKPGGTGFKVGFKPEWNVAGKTGSAEVAGQEKTDGWFVAFAPVENPEVAILVLIEGEGHGGSTAAPIVRELMAAALEPSPVGGWFSDASGDSGGAAATGAVTVDGTTRPLPRPFLVLATQNPFEFEGTYPLPESQLDRFLIRLKIGYPTREQELLVLKNQRLSHPLERLTPVVTAADVLFLQETTRAVRVDEGILDYIVSLAQQSREAPELAVGISPRGSLCLRRSAQALALVRGRDYVVPDDIKELALPVLAHRVVPDASGGSTNRAEEALTAILESL
ncbi:AAA family ATPase, partial [Candidatus Sumerlaeota bacterium]|nr:AAA family ATPase [Candidatus Sumerlaeota bacterium]